MSNLLRLKKQLDSVKEEIERLADFRDTPFVRKFRRQLQGEISHINQEIKKITETQQEKQQRHDNLIDPANKTRSAKNKRTWNYVKSIQQNYFPDKSITEIRSALKKHRQGLETDIPDIAWRNPSP